MNEVFIHLEAVMCWLNSQAGALQAIAAILALALSIFVPYRLDANARKRADEEREIQAAALAVAIFPEILEISASLTGTNRAWANAGGQILGPGAAAGLDIFKISAPPNLTMSLDRLHLLGNPAGTTLVQLASILAQYNRMIEAMQVRVASNQQVDLAHARTAAVGHLSAIDQLLNRAKEEITPIHDAAAKR